MKSQEDWFTEVRQLFSKAIESRMPELATSPGWSVIYRDELAFEARKGLPEPGKIQRLILRSESDKHPSIVLTASPSAVNGKFNIRCRVVIGFESEFSKPGGRAITIEDYFHSQMNRLDLEKMLDWHPGEDVTAYFTRVFELTKFALRGELRDVVEDRQWIDIHSKNPRDYGY